MIAEFASACFGLEAIEQEIAAITIAIKATAQTTRAMIVPVESLEKPNDCRDKPEELEEFEEELELKCSTQ